MSIKISEHNKCGTNQSYQLERAINILEYNIKFYIVYYIIVLHFTL